MLDAHYSSGCIRIHVRRYFSPWHSSIAHIILSLWELASVNDDSNEDREINWVVVKCCRGGRGERLLIQWNCSCFVYDSFLKGSYLKEWVSPWSFEIKEFIVPRRHIVTCFSLEILLKFSCVLEHNCFLASLSSVKVVIACPILHKLIWFFRVLMKVYNILWLKFLNGSVKNTFFTLSKSALFSARWSSSCCFKS